MKRIYKKAFSKKPSLGSVLRASGPGPATSTSTLTLTTSSTDLTPSGPACNTTAATQVTAGVSVSVQLRLSHL